MDQTPAQNPNQSNNDAVPASQVDAVNDVPVEPVGSFSNDLNNQQTESPQDVVEQLPKSDDGEALIQEIDESGNVKPVDKTTGSASLLDGDAGVESEKSSPSKKEQPSNGISSSSVSNSILDVLHKKELISDGQFEELRVESARTGKRAEDILLEQGLVSEDAFSQARAEYLNVPYIKLAEVAVSPEALSVLPEAVSRRYKTLPFSVDNKNNTLSVAMVNPLDLQAIDFVEKKTGMRVVPHLVTESDMDLAFSEQYAQTLSGEVSAALKDTQEATKRTIDVTQLGQVIREAPIAKIVETLLTFALRSRASDVHIEPQETKTRVRYRIDGILREKLVLPLKVHDAVVSRIKILARLKIDERRLPQDGRFNFTANNEEVDLRVSSLPTVHGEKVVMRLLKKTSVVPTLPDLGLRGRALKNLEDAVLVPHGIVLITGPTGSGKTTTLYAILSKINTPKVNIITLEDPVEYEMPGVNQVQINTTAGLTFASGLRSFLRQDPNVIMVGEVRDNETADLAIQASLTGHLVFSTLHTNSSAGALPRLLDMEAEPFLLASSMTAIVAQRVTRKICEHCKEEYSPEQEVIDDIKDVLGSLYDGFVKQKKINGKQPTLFKGKGCSECGDSGYSGRIGIFEVMPITNSISKLILERAPASAVEEAAIAEGMMLMKQDGYMKSLEGATTLEEVLRVAEV
ncbi:GspE/PulE family protein [Patescibacteria group bacterium]